MANLNRAQRHVRLLKSYFTPLEARELSKLPANNPALPLLIKERLKRRKQFNKAAEIQIERGNWEREDLPRHWSMNLRRMYTVNRWRVKSGPTGRQYKLPKGSPNPWEMYRDALRFVGGDSAKPYKSDWQTNQIRTNKTRLSKGLVFVQALERQIQKGGIVNPKTIRDRQKNIDRQLATSTGRNKTQLIIEKRRLDRILRR